MSLDLQPLAPHRKPSTASKALFVLAAVLLLVSLALISAAVTNQVAISSAHATATAQTHATSLARAATGTASAVLAATTIAQANATATVQAQSTAIARAQAHATATAQANVTATAQAVAAQDPYPPYRGTLVLSDPLHNNSQGHRWDVYTLEGNICHFSEGVYESFGTFIPGYLDGYNACLAEQTNFSNFTFQVQMSLLKGDCMGIVFREHVATDSHYSFDICVHGTYVLRTVVNHNYAKELGKGTSSAIHRGYSHPNVVAVVASGTSLTIYVNGQKVVQVSDGSFQHGQIGCESAYVTTPTDVLFWNANVWIF